MTAVEGRLRAVARALTESVPDASIPPLRLPLARRHVRPPTWFTPVAAAMAIAALTWTAGLIGARITGAGALSSATGHLLAGRSPVASAHPSASSPPAFVPSHQKAVQYSSLSAAGIKGPRQRRLLDPVFRSMAASAANSASSTCVRGAANRKDVCTLGV